ATTGVAPGGVHPVRFGGAASIGSVAPGGAEGAAGLAAAGRFGTLAPSGSRACVTSVSARTTTTACGFSAAIAAIARGFTNGMTDPFLPAIDGMGSRACGARRASTTVTSPTSRGTLGMIRSWDSRRVVLLIRAGALVQEVDHRARALSQ
ncbi:MAG: hypothetical protein KIT31_42240, partial [Deltaproteobacteria bacterium]|nr:hypothetical protein [Deltaproteobacteria bacterium]